jgi:hypothetical protein
MGNILKGGRFQFESIALKLNWFKTTRIRFCLFYPNQPRVSIWVLYESQV